MKNKKTVEEVIKFLNKKTIEAYFAVLLFMVFGLVLVVAFIYLSFISFYIVSKTASPEVVPFDDSLDYSLESINEEGLYSEVALVGIGDGSPELPQIPSEKEEVKKVEVVGNGQIRNVSAYNTVESQCSGNPCISASGDDICELLEKGTNVCAANWIPFGTVIEVEGMGRCLVLDRMASRFSQNVDWAMGSDEKQEALDFGRRNLRVWVIN